MQASGKVTWLIVYADVGHMGKHPRLDVDLEEGYKASQHKLHCTKKAVSIGGTEAGGNWRPSSRVTHKALEATQRTGRYAPTKVDLSNNLMQ
jgi:hypothetical protein